MFRLINSHLQAYSLQVKSQDAVHTLRSQCAYISEIQDESLARGPKLLSMYTVEQRGFLVRKYW